MASLIKKKKANTIYYYVVESARVDGKPRIVHQTYLGTAEKCRPAGPGSHRTGAAVGHHASSSACPALCGWQRRSRESLQLLQSLWPKPRSGPSTAHYLLLAAIHRICQPGPKTEVADWYRRQHPVVAVGICSGTISARRLSGIALIASLPASRCLQASRMNWKRRSCDCSVYGRKSNW